MATKPVVLYQRFCRSCGEAFYICKSCDRGHCYCGKTCSYHARLIKCRGYNRKIEKASKDDEIMRTGNVSIDAAKEK